MKIPVYGKLKKLEQDGMTASIGRLYAPMKDLVGSICKRIEKGEKTDAIRKAFEDKYLLIKPTRPDNGVTWSVISKLYNMMGGFKSEFEKCNSPGQASSLVMEKFFNALEILTNEGREPYFGIEVDKEEILGDNVAEAKKSVQETKEVVGPAEEIQGEVDIQAEIENNVIRQMEGYDLSNPGPSLSDNIKLLEKW